MAECLQFLLRINTTLSSKDSKLDAMQREITSGKGGFNAFATLLYALASIMSTVAGWLLPKFNSIRH